MISASSVLWGICHPACRLRNPNTLADDELVTLSQTNYATHIYFDPEDERDGEKAADGTLRSYVSGFRVRITFRYDELSAADARQWGKLFNAFAAGYYLILIPHYDDALKLEFNVQPSAGFRLGYIADKYIGHNGTFEFISRTLLPGIPLVTSTNVFSPVIH